MGTLLSVRGEAGQTVAPDYVRLSCQLDSHPATKQEAQGELSAAQSSLLSDLAGRGGVALSVGTERAPLTWSSYSSTEEEEHEPDPQTGNYRLTGRVTAMVSILVTVRTLDTLDELSALLGTHDRLRVDGISWGVDPDNPAWPQVRATAIRAALRKGRDYAAALGSSLRSVEHIADAGLLHGGESPYRGGWFEQQSAMARSASRGVPTLDPVPQLITATIEARFVADGVVLTDL